MSSSSVRGRHHPSLIIDLIGAGHVLFGSIIALAMLAFLVRCAIELPNLGAPGRGGGVMGSRPIVDPVGLVLVAMVIAALVLILGVVQCACGIGIIRRRGWSHTLGVGFGVLCSLPCVWLLPALVFEFQGFLQGIAENPSARVFLVLELVPVLLGIPSVVFLIARAEEFDDRPAPASRSQARPLDHTDQGLPPGQGSWWSQEFKGERFRERLRVIPE
jgi:hypothetical protein